MPKLHYVNKEQLPRRNESGAQFQAFENLRVSLYGFISPNIAGMPSGTDIGYAQNVIGLADFLDYDNKVRNCADFLGLR